MKEAPAPGLDLIRQVRAGFIAQGTTLTEWCRNHQTSHTNARHALVGSWNGPKGKAMRARIAKAAGVIAHKDVEKAA